MEKSDIYQIFGIFVIVVIFIWENRKVSGVDKIFLWVLFGSIIAIFFILNLYFYIKNRFDLVDKNRQEILKLKDQVSFRKSLEEINYKLGKLEKKGDKK